MRLGQGKIIKGRRSVREEGKASSLQVIPEKSKRINEKTNTNNKKKFIKVPGYIIYLKKSNTCSSDDNTENVLFMTSTMSFVTQACLTLCDPMKSSPPGSSVPGILQAGILECVAVSSSRGSSRPRDRTQVSCVCLLHCRRILYH